MSPWPHSPIHRLGHPGAYIVTGSTDGKNPFFSGSENLATLTETLFELAEKYAWQLQAWAVFPNHYHFVATSPAEAATLATLIRHFHSITAIDLNRRQRQAGRKVWFQYWETHITHPGSYLARLSYVHNNAVKHGLVSNAALYPWCSAAWFEQKAEPAFRRQVAMTKTDRINVRDDFDVSAMDIGQATSD